MEGRRPKKVRREGDHEMVARAVSSVREALDASWMWRPFLTPPVKFCRTRGKWGKLECKRLGGYWDEDVGLALT